MAGQEIRALLNHVRIALRDTAQPRLLVLDEVVGAVTAVLAALLGTPVSAGHHATLAVRSLAPLAVGASTGSQAAAARRELATHAGTAAAADLAALGGHQSATTATTAESATSTAEAAAGATTGPHAATGHPTTCDATGHASATRTFGGLLRPDGVRTELGTA